jgi:hypothetical protein
VSYSSAGLSAISYANGFTLWHYRSDDTAAEIMAPGYFNPAHKMLRVADFIFVNASFDTAEIEHGCIVVLSNSGGAVAVGPGMNEAFGAKP